MVDGITVGLGMRATVRQGVLKQGGSLPDERGGEPAEAGLDYMVRVDQQGIAGAEVTGIGGLGFSFCSGL